MFPNNNNNNFNYNNNNNFNTNNRFVRPQTQPDAPDPSLLNNAALFQMIQHMSVPQPMTGFAGWTTSPHNTPGFSNNNVYGFGGVTPQRNTPGSHFDQQRLIDTPSPRPLSPRPTSPDVEIVKETQPERQPDYEVASSQGRKQKRAHKKKANAEPRAKTISIPLSKEEEMALCTAWLSVTEDPHEANYQKAKTYWFRITEDLLKLTNKPHDYRDSEGVSAKWRKMRPKIQRFAQIYTRLNNANNHQSGASDADVIKKALAEYHGTYLAHFKFLDIWDKLRYSSKFHYVTENNVKATRGEPTKKRSKTTSSTEPQSQGSDARVNIDLNDYTFDDESAFQERAPGRDAAKKAAQGGSSSSSGKGKGKARYSETFDSLAMKLDGLFESSKVRTELGEKKLQAKNEQIKLAELKMLSTDYSNLPEPQRSIMEKAKQDIMEKYRAM